MDVYKNQRKEKKRPTERKIRAHTDIPNAFYKDSFAEGDPAAARKTTIGRKITRRNGKENERVESKQE
jgi:hypothetical protein